MLDLRPDGARDGERGEWEATRSTFDNQRWTRREGVEQADGPLIRISGTELVAADIYTYTRILPHQLQRELTSAQRRQLLDEARDTQPGTLRATCAAAA